MFVLLDGKHVSATLVHVSATLVQSGSDPDDVLSLQGSFCKSATFPQISHITLGMTCRKSPAKMRHAMGLECGITDMYDTCILICTSRVQREALGHSDLSVVHDS